MREAAGPDVDIMLDAWMSWNKPYTLEFARRVAHLDLKWIEEPVMPDKIALCAEINAASPVPIATGEHEYTRWGQKELLDAGASEYLQADTYWAGGLSEMVKICTLASTYDIPVIAHGHSVPGNVHLTPVHAGAALPAGRVPGEVERATAILLEGTGQAGRWHDHGLGPARVRAWTSTRRRS